MTITYSDFLQTIADNEGEVLATKDRKAMFRAATAQGGVRFIPLSSGTARSLGEDGAQKYLSVFNKTQSIKRTDYPKELFHKSYVLAVIQLWLGQRQAGELMSIPENRDENGVPQEGADELADLERAAEFSTEEGKKRVRSHLVRERSRELVQLAKELFQARHGGRLFCEVCGFDFGRVYGEPDFIEVHHCVPLRDLEPGTKTKVSALAMVCANCHRMLHRGNPWPEVEDLRRRIKPLTEQ